MISRNLFKTTAALALVAAAHTAFGLDVAEVAVRETQVADGRGRVWGRTGPAAPSV